MNQYFLGLFRERDISALCAERGKTSVFYTTSLVDCFQKYHQSPFEKDETIKKGKALSVSQCHF